MYGNITLGLHKLTFTLNYVFSNSLVNTFAENIERPFLPYRYLV